MSRELSQTTHGRVKDVSELVVLGFRDRHRAPEVLNELRRREADWAVELNEAVVVTRDEGGGVMVQLSIDPTAREGAGWARLWGSLLNLVMLRPVADGLSAAVSNASAAFTQSVGATPVVSGVGEPDAAWWKKNVRLSKDFIRDVGAIMQPGYSTLLILSRDETATPLLRRLRGYDGTLLHAMLDWEQEGEVAAAPAKG
jgi:uncharacterized membrane protein